MRLGTKEGKAKWLERRKAMPDPKKTEVTPDGKTEAQKRFLAMEEKVARLEADLEAREKEKAEAERAAQEAQEAAKADSGFSLDDLLP